MSDERMSEFPALENPDQDPDNLDQDAENKDLNGTKVIVYNTKVNGYPKKRQKRNKSNCL